MENKNTTSNVLQSISKFFRYKAGEIISIFKFIGETYWKGIVFLVKRFAVFALVFIIAGIISLLFYGLYKYFTPVLYLLAAAIIFSPFIVFIIKKWKTLFLFISIGISWFFLIFAAGWEIHRCILKKNIDAALLDPQGFIPVYSMILTLLLWLIVNGGKLYSKNYIMPFIKKFTSIQSKGLFIIFLLLVAYTLYFQFNLRVILAVFFAAGTLVLAFFEVRKSRNARNDKNNFTPSRQSPAGEG